MVGEWGFGVRGGAAVGAGLPEQDDPSEAPSHPPPITQQHPSKPSMPAHSKNGRYGHQWYLKALTVGLK